MNNYRNNIKMLKAIKMNKIIFKINKNKINNCYNI